MPTPARTTMPRRIACSRVSARDTDDSPPLPCDQTIGHAIIPAVGATRQRWRTTFAFDRVYSWHGICNCGYWAIDGAETNPAPVANRNSWRTTDEDHVKRRSPRHRVGPVSDAARLGSDIRLPVQPRRC